MRSSEKNKVGGGFAGLFRWKKSPTNATAFDVTEPVSKTPNLTPVVRQEVMVDPPTSRELKYECISESPAYKGWRSILRRKIRGPQGKIRSYDVITQEHPSVLVFTWDTQTNTTTILKEYYPGMNRLMYGVVGGNYEADKHTSALQAAACELEEEAHLHEGTWYALMKDERTVAGAGKYSTQVFHSYLVVDPVVKGTPRGLDDGEFIEYIRGVSLEEVRAMIHSGDMSVTSGFAALMAIEKLRELGHIM
ncbi:unnamed protein product [Ectocarpus sp. CCAP 1310/34]|nr:unnamed protein product [Ectocarpus sp. CCAP 1310/34]